LPPSVAWPRISDLEVGDAARAGAQRLGRVLELGERRGRADGRARAVALDAREAGAPDQQRTRRP
jgi:hypothetical protein